MYVERCQLAASVFCSEPVPCTFNCTNTGYLRAHFICFSVPKHTSHSSDYFRDINRYLKFVSAVYWHVAVDNKLTVRLPPFQHYGKNFLLTPKIKYWNRKKRKVRCEAICKLTKLIPTNLNTFHKTHTLYKQLAILWNFIF
jgi:hypothetical protein